MPASDPNHPAGAATGGRIDERLAHLRARLDAAAVAAGRPAGSACLIGVAKTRQPDEVVAAVRAGLTDVGENYADEGEGAIAAVRAAGLPCRWHYIGHLQGNKTRVVAAQYDWVHTVDRLRVATRLDAQRPAGLPPLAVLLQTNFAAEASKSGVADLAGLRSLARAVRALPNLHLRGLMALPPPEADARAAFAEVRAALEMLRADARSDGDAAAADRLDTLSMGMSDDFEAAIAEGATMVRIGTALFGPRPGPAASTARDTPHPGDAAH